MKRTAFAAGMDVRREAAKRRRVAALRGGMMALGAIPPGPIVQYRRRRPAALGVEKKFYDTALGETAIAQTATDASGSIYDPSTTSMISTPAQGDTDQNRDGKKINILSCQVRGFVRFPVQINQTVAEEACIVDLYLLLDSQSNAAQLTSQSAFKNIGAAVGLYI